MKVIAVIPARYGSTRFPGKSLQKILGKPMIQHVYEKAKKVEQLDEVIVATDNVKIYDTVISFGGNAVMTKVEHESGSDRIAEVAGKIDGDIFLNIQGDEPLIHPNLIAEIVRTSKENLDSVVTAKIKINDAEEINSPNCVKVITDNKNNAIYFSRSVIPYNRENIHVDYYKHLGIYCYPRHLLIEYIKLPKSLLENTEMLEQLRLLENGYKMKVVESFYDSIGVDTPEDIQKVEKLLEAEKWVRQ
ncbi:3-deoxy-manno-octulosonate cytidylyltransferase [Bacillus circulans]|uniref:3-deoxy-manno-octulosonate cytidylyltransferase n=1 Tax=Niallia circulans TaxID=1397 RepID=UPI00031F4D45|nr:3-deoxy-manno-octulosonate cytidylyltransferase [Niallia circulans]NRG29499.1 3-deoxy-manno-octulosonate cytidylyltransferase [Niallia circulans]